LACGTLAAGRIEAAADADLFSFYGQAGRIISLALASTGGFSGSGSSASATLTLFALSSAVVGSFRSNGQTDFTLADTGLYVIRVTATNLATIGSYEVRRNCS
jgi:hypothetical protein